MMATSVVLLVMAKSAKAFCLDNTRFYEMQDEQKLVLQAFASSTMAQTAMSRRNPFRKSIKVALRLRLPEAW